MATKRLYIGNIPWEATEQDIREFFAGHQVIDVRIIVDHDTKRPRGFAFVELATEKAALDAVSDLDGRDFGGRTARIREANERPGDSDGKRERRGRRDSDR